MKLRRLNSNDAQRMYDWMHDTSVVEKMQTDFRSKTMEDCNAFIANSYTQQNRHMAIVDDNDIYMGTVSLKHITDQTAEFAITICKDAMGKGYSSWAMKEIIRIAFEQYNINTIYWCVAPDNIRALKFYDKNGYKRVTMGKIEYVDGYTQEQRRQYIWYKITK